MNTSKILTGLILVFVLGTCANSYAQAKPKAILVQLRSEYKRISYLQETRQRKKANEMKRDAQLVAQVMINDFEDHFSFCPVYYYYDTNYHLILQHKFEGVLLNAQGEPASDIVLGPGDTNFYITYFGPVTHYNNTTMGKGLILADDQGKVVAQYWRGEYFDIFKPDARYSFTSKKFDLRYFATATKLDAQMREPLEKFDAANK